MTWNKFYVGTEAQVIAANQQIDSNCSFPDGRTTTWAIPVQAYGESFWFIAAPPPGGYNNGIGNWTQAQMIAGVQNVTLEDGNPDWWPPAQI